MPSNFFQKIAFSNSNMTFPFKENNYQNLHLKKSQSFLRWLDENPQSHPIFPSMTIRSHHTTLHTVKLRIQFIIIILMKTSSFSQQWFFIKFCQTQMKNSLNSLNTKKWTNSRDTHKIFCQKWTFLYIKSTKKINLDRYLQTFNTQKGKNWSFIFCWESI